MEISIAKNSDIPQLCKLLNILFTQEEEFVPDESNQSNALRMIIENPGTGEIFVAKEKDLIIGAVSLLYSISTALGGKVATLEDMIVSPESRGCGVGSKLITYAIKHAKNNNYKRITLLTDTTNKSAHNFYLKNGFSQSSMKIFRLLIDGS
jgi:GNAT superfamily N-acetyltransferase